MNRQTAGNSTDCSRRFLNEKRPSRRPPLSPRRGAYLRESIAFATVGSRSVWRVVRVQPPVMPALAKFFVDRRDLSLASLWEIETGKTAVPFARHRVVGSSGLNGC